MVVSLEQAIKAKKSLKDQLARPDWLRGIGVGQNERGEHLIEVRVGIDTQEVREAIPASIEGVPIRVTVIGNVRPQ